MNILNKIMKNLLLTNQINSYISYNYTPCNRYFNSNNKYWHNYIINNKDLLFIFKHSLHSSLNYTLVNVPVIKINLPLISLNGSHGMLISLGQVVLTKQKPKKSFKFT